MALLRLLLAGEELHVNFLAVVVVEEEGAAGAVDGGGFDRRTKGAVEDVGVGGYELGHGN